MGEFYEAMGTDAVILVQWAGLNPMGSTHMPPRAGCPVMNIRRTLQSLVEEANLSVVRLALSMSLKAIHVANRTPHRSGLNKMGRTHMSHYADCPHMNTSRTLQSRVEENNLSMVWRTLGVVSDSLSYLCNEHLPHTAPHSRGGFISCRVQTGQAHMCMMVVPDQVHIVNSVQRSYGTYSCRCTYAQRLHAEARSQRKSLGSL